MDNDTTEVEPIPEVCGHCRGSKHVTVETDAGPMPTLCLECADPDQEV